MALALSFRHSDRTASLTFSAFYPQQMMVFNTTIQPGEVYSSFWACLYQSQKKRWSNEANSIIAESELIIRSLSSPSVSPDVIVTRLNKVKKKQRGRVQ